MAILRGGRERERVSSLLGMRRGTRKSREESERKKRSERGRGRICPGEKSHQARYTGITPLVRSARGSNEIPGPGPRTRGYIQRSAGREHTHLRWAEQRYITRAPRDTSPADSLPLSSVSPSAGLSTSLFLSPFLSRSQNALSRPAFPRGWIAARGYVRNCGTKSAFAEELTVHRGGHKVLLILIDFDSRKPVTSGYE